MTNDEIMTNDKSPNGSVAGRFSTFIGHWSLVIGHSAFLALGLWCFSCAAASPKPLPALSLGGDGHLIYNSDPQGNRIPDFSQCGYAGGDRQIPDAPVRVVVSPAKGDNTAQIQEAIDYVAKQPADTNGLRGAVLL